MKFTLLAASAAVASAQRLFTVGTSANGATANLRNDGTLFNNNYFSNSNNNYFSIELN